MHCVKKEKGKLWAKHCEQEEDGSNPLQQALFWMNFVRMLALTKQR
jgi:hypothetical protein